MRLLDDERGQSVQVGAAILLGFVVITITIYQVEVVANQNAEVEFNHNQEVRQDLTDLRNSINNAGSQGDSDSVSVKLGGQYPPRTIFVNPPPIQGLLRSQEAGNISFGNARVQGSYEGSGNSTELVDGNHTTNRLVYAPRYFELDDAGVTSIEHSLAFNAFENNATDPLTRQRVVRGDSLTLTVVRGNLSEQGTQSVPLDPETVSGPTDPITVTNDSAGPIELYLPTERPSVWNETVGTTFSEGASDARVADWDAGSGAVTLELQKDQYELRMALVEVGDGVNETDRYDVQERSGGGGGSSAYATFWQDPSGRAGTSNCDSESCTLDAQTTLDLQLTMGTDPIADGASVEYAVGDQDVGTVDPTTGTTDSAGEHSTTFTADGNGVVNVYVSSGSDGDVIEITVENFSYTAEKVVFTRSYDDALFVVNDTTVPSNHGGRADVIGPVESDLDGDGLQEIPYVDGKKLSVIDETGSSQRIAGGSTKPFSGASLLAVGTWETAEDWVYFVGENQDEIYRSRPGQSPTSVVLPDNGVDAVVGIADITDDGNEELLYVDNSQALRYVPNSSVTAGTSIHGSVGQNNGGIGVGAPADFDDGGVPRVPVVNGNSNLVLVADDGTTETIATTNLTKSPVASVDWDADGQTEIVFVAKDGTLKYVDDVGGSNTIKLADGQEPPGEDSGAA